jgi:5-methylcytosine-specific restriction endonuclease McrA
MSEVLVLNFSYEPLGVTDLKRAVRLLFARKAEVVHAGGELRSVTSAFPLPSIVRMLYYIKRHRKTVALTKKNVLLRDDYVCGYCSSRGGLSSMTVDHILPKSRGGRSSWTNLIACCSPCNTRKNNRTPDEARMPLRKTPREPRFIPWIVVKRNTHPTEWTKYLTLYSVGIEERVSD